ncbi:DUF11 domain-containing protein, partial [Wenzhouxiangella sp. XN79A]|uniref:integrin alpha n=1 Tax=Wenzhouxiangella sp. XN79A TaxID=2724193 RepID=UPI00144AEFDF
MTQHRIASLHTRPKMDCARTASLPSTSTARRVLPLAVAAALGVGGPSAALAQSFPAEIELSALDGTNGFVLNGEAASDLSGFSVSAAGDINGDGIDDLIIGAYGADPNGSLSGRSYVVFGSGTVTNPFELSGLDGSNGVVINGEAAYDFSAVSVSAAGDINGDGIEDLIIGANGADPNGSSSGRSYVVFGSGTVTNPVELSSLDGSNGVVLNGEAAGDNAGYSVSAAGDINGDGIDDLIIGADSADPNGISSGRSYVVFGDDAGLPTPFNLSTLNGLIGVVLNGEAARDSAGFSVSAAGDVNGDGIGDLIIGAPDAETDGIGSGRAYVVFGSGTGLASPVELSSLNGSNGVVFIGEAEADFAGRSVSAAGDINGDGIGDLIIGADGADSSGEDSGRSYVVFGASILPTPFDLSTLNGVNGFVLNGEAAGDYAGRSVSAAGDINGDGIDDLLIGANRADPDGIVSAGRSYVVFGSDTGLPNPFDLSTLNGSNGFVLNGEAAGDYAGWSVSAAGDVNGDGIDDVVIGAFGADPNGSSSGRSYVVFGRSSTDVAVSKSNGAAFVDNGLPTTWLIDVANVGAADIAGATLSDPVPTGVTGATWTCTAFGGAVCTNPSGSGGISENVDLPAGASLVYEFTATVTA